MNNYKQNWDSASWEGSRIAQLKNSLKLTPQQRFEALEDFSQVSDWLARSGKSYHFRSNNNDQKGT